MKNLWLQYESRIDALSLRERVMVFVAALVAVLFLGNTLFVDPAVMRKRVLADQIARQSKELQGLQVQIAELEKSAPTRMPPISAAATICAMKSQPSTTV